MYIYSIWLYRHITHLIHKIRFIMHVHTLRQSSAVNAENFCVASSHDRELVQRMNARFTVSSAQNCTASSFSSLREIVAWNCTCTLCKGCRRCCLNSGVDIRCFLLSFWSYKAPSSYISITVCAFFHTYFANTAWENMFSLWVREKP